MKGIRNFKSLLWSVVLMMSVCSVGFGQSEWEHKLKFINYSTLHQVTQTTDSCIWAVGTANTSFKKMEVVKFSNNGKIILNKTFNQVNEHPDIKATNDNGVVISLIDSDSLLVMKLTKNGSFEWQKKIELNKNIGYSETKIKELSNGNIFIFFFSRKGFSPIDITMCSFIQLDKDGKFLWKQQHDFNFPFNLYYSSQYIDDIGVNFISPDYSSTSINKIHYIKWE